MNHYVLMGKEKAERADIKLLISQINRGLNTAAMTGFAFVESYDSQAALFKAVNAGKTALTKHAKAFPDKYLLLEVSMDAKKTIKIVKDVFSFIALDIVLPEPAPSTHKPFAREPKTEAVLREEALTSAFSQLGIKDSKDKTHEQARKAYHELAKIHHPDKGGNMEAFKAIGSAWALVQKEMPRVTASPFSTACAFASAGAGTSAARHEPSPS